MSRSISEHMWMCEISTLSDWWLESWHNVNHREKCVCMCLCVCVLFFSLSFCWLHNNSGPDEMPLVSSGAAATKEESDLRQLWHEKCHRLILGLIIAAHQPASIYLPSKLSTSSSSSLDMIAIRFIHVHEFNMSTYEGRRFTSPRCPSKPSFVFLRDSGVSNKLCTCSLCALLPDKSAQLLRSQTHFLITSVPRGVRINFLYSRALLWSKPALLLSCSQNHAITLSLREAKQPSTLAYLML